MSDSEVSISIHSSDAGTIWTSIELYSRRSERDTKKGRLRVHKKNWCTHYSCLCVCVVTLITSDNVGNDKNGRKKCRRVGQRPKRTNGRPTGHAMRIFPAVHRRVCYNNKMPVEILLQHIYVSRIRNCEQSSSSRWRGQLLLLQSVQPPSPPPVLCTERVSWPIFRRRVVSCFGSLLFFILSTRPLGAVSRSWATGSLVLLIAFAANNIVCTVRARAFARDAALLWCCSPLVPPPAHPFVFIFIAPQRKTRTHTHIHARSYDRNGIHRHRRRPFPALALSHCARRVPRVCVRSFVRSFSAARCCSRLRPSLSFMRSTIPSSFRASARPPADLFVRCFFFV